MSKLEAVPESDEEPREDLSDEEDKAELDRYLLGKKDKEFAKHKKELQKVKKDL